jgi:LEA14-like dessication related protein
MDGRIEREVIKKVWELERGERGDIKLSLNNFIARKGKLFHRVHFNLQVFNIEDFSSFLFLF